MSDAKTNPNGLLRKGAIGGLIKLVGVGAGFLFFLLVAQRTDPAQFGIFASAFSLATILGFAATGGQHVAILRFWPALSETQGQGVAEAALRPTLFLPVLILVIMFVGGGIFTVLFASWLDRAASPDLVFATLLLAAAFTMSEYHVAALRARGQLVLSLGPREILWRGFAITGIFFFVAPVSAELALTVSAVTLILATLPQNCMIFPRILSANPDDLSQTERQKIRSAIPGLWGVAVAMPITQHATTVVVALALGPVAAGAYFAADRLARLLIIAMFGVNQIAGPKLSRAFHAGDIAAAQAVAMQASNIAVVAALLGLAAYAGFGGFMLSLFDPSFVSAYGVLVILSLGGLVNALSGANELLLQIAGQERRYFWVVFGWGIGGVLVAFVLASLFGIVGAGLATALALAGRSLHAVYLCKRDLGILTLPGLRKDR